MFRLLPIFQAASSGYVQAAVFFFFSPGFALLCRRCCVQAASRGCCVQAAATFFFLPTPYLILSSFNRSLEFQSISYLSSTRKQESYVETLKVLSEAKPATDNFFDNVIVNDKNLDIKKNRLELLNMLCKTYDNFIDFSKIEGVN